MVPACPAFHPARGAAPSLKLLDLADFRVLLIGDEELLQTIHFLFELAFGAVGLLCIAILITEVTRSLGLTRRD
jgi:hypothetical protein